MGRIRMGKVKTIFTGSSRHYMNLLFNDSQSPFYHFVETVPFPELDKDFLDFISDNLKRKHKLSVSLKDLTQVFSSIDCSPYWMMKIISHMITFDESLNKSQEYVLQLIEAAEDFDGVIKKMKPIDKIVFLALSEEQSPFSKELLAKIEQETSVKGIFANVQRSIHRLIEQNLVSQIEKGVYKIEKPGLKRYLLKNNNNIDKI